MPPVTNNSSEQSTQAPSSRGSNRPPLRLTYTHEAMIDLILQEPSVTTRELAEVFSKSQSWIARVVIADSFKARMAERKAHLVDPHISRSVNERLQSVAIQSLEIISEKLDKADVTAAFALESLGLATGGLRGR